MLIGISENWNSRISSLYVAPPRVLVTDLVNARSEPCLTEFQSAIGKNTSWCYAGPQVQNLGLNYRIGAVKATVYKGVTTCHIQSLILQGPGNKGSDRSSGSNSTTSVTTRKELTTTEIGTSTGMASANPTSTAAAFGTSSSTVASPTQTAAGYRLTRNSWVLGILLFFFM